MHAIMTLSLPFKAPGLTVSGSSKPHGPGPGSQLDNQTVKVQLIYESLRRGMWTASVSSYAQGVDSILAGNGPAICRAVTRAPQHCPACAQLRCAFTQVIHRFLHREACLLARELAIRCQIAASASTIGRWLSGDALKPWQHRSWISVRDPGFAAKAARVLDLYAGIWDGAPLGSNDYVICADEKTSIQARCRCHPTLPPGKARAMRVEHDYRRGGALAYLAAWDVRRGQVTGRCEHTTGIALFSRLVEQVMTAEPYASADRVFWIVDNGSSHRGAASVNRMMLR